MTDPFNITFDSVVELNGQKITKHFIQSLSKQEREDLIEPLFKIFRTKGWIYPDDLNKMNKSYQRILDVKSNLENMELFNNSSVGTDICKYFCAESFYNSTEMGKPTMIQIFEDDEKLKKIIWNRLGLDWLETDEKGPGVNEAFNLSFKMLIQGMRSMRLVPAISMFKPDIAKFMYEKYSNAGDTVFDYSCGFGGRLLGAMTTGRKYIGTDPLTVKELEGMAQYFKFKDYRLIHSGSEHYRGDQNSVDFSFSSPPYFNQESYANDITQAYNQGEGYFYNVYWKQTLENVRYMLKPGKWFGLNVKNFPKMLEMAEELFGEVKERVTLKTVRSHLTKSAGVLKDEYIYMFENRK